MGDILGLLRRVAVSLSGAFKSRWHKRKYDARNDARHGHCASCTSIRLWSVGGEAPNKWARDLSSHHKCHSD